MLRTVAGSETGMASVGVLERRHHPILGQAARRQPAAHIGECAGDAKDHRADRAQPGKHFGIAH